MFLFYYLLDEKLHDLVRQYDILQESCKKIESSKMFFFNIYFFGILRSGFFMARTLSEPRTLGVLGATNVLF